MDTSSFIFGRSMCEYKSITSGVLTLRMQLSENQWCCSQLIFATILTYRSLSCDEQLCYLLLLTFITYTNNGDIILSWFAFAHTVCEFCRNHMAQYFTFGYRNNLSYTYLLWVGVPTPQCQCSIHRTECNFLGTRSSQCSQYHPKDISPITAPALSVMSPR